MLFINWVIKKMTLACLLLLTFPMRIGIAHWQSRVSPVFDVADRLLLIDLDGGREQHRENVMLIRRDPFERAKEVSGFCVEILLCGAVSRVMETALINAGVQVFSFICGDLETILAAFLMEKLSDDRFLMPGCRGKRKSLHFRLGRGTKRISPDTQIHSLVADHDPGTKTAAKDPNAGSRK